MFNPLNLLKKFNRWVEDQHPLTKQELLEMVRQGKAIYMGTLLPGESWPTAANNLPRDAQAGTIRLEGGANK